MIDDDEIIVDEELAEYFEKGDFSDLTFRTIYEKYSTLLFGWTWYSSSR